MPRTILVALAVTIADGNLVPNGKWDADDLQEYIDKHVVSLVPVSVLDPKNPEFNYEPQIFASYEPLEGGGGDVSCACAPRPLAGAAELYNRRGYGDPCPRARRVRHVRQ